MKYPAGNEKTATANETVMEGSTGRALSWQSYMVAATGLAAVTPQAQAALSIYDVNPDISIPLSGSIYFDLDRSGSAPYTGGSSFAAADFQLYFCDPGVPAIRSIGPNSLIVTTQPMGGYASKLMVGDLIDGSSNLHGGAPPLAYDVNGPWAGGGEGYLGLAISSGADKRYGWAHVVYGPSDDTLTLVRFALESDLNVGAAFSVVPEVNRPLALALGLGGLACLQARRRRAAAAQA